MPGTADIEECLDRQHWIERDVSDPAVLSRLFQMSGEVGPLEGLSVVAFPDVSVALRVDFQIEPAFLIEDVREPGIVAPVRLNDDSIVGLLKLSGSHR